MKAAVAKIYSSSPASASPLPSASKKLGHKPLTEFDFGLSPISSNAAMAPRLTMRQLLDLKLRDGMEPQRELAAAYREYVLQILDSCRSKNALVGVIYADCHEHTVDRNPLESIGICATK